MKKQNNKKGFTLVEVMVALFLSVLVSFFVYTMMISSYTAYNRLSSISKNANGIRFFMDMFSNSVKYASAFPTLSGSTTLKFTRFDKSHNCVVNEEYYFSGGGTFVENETKAKQENNTDYYKKALGILKKKVTRKSDGKLFDDIVVSNIIRTVYFYKDTSAARYKKLRFCVVYDDVISGQVNRTTGKMEKSADGRTEMDASTITQRRILLDCRGF